MLSSLRLHFPSFSSLHLLSTLLILCSLCAAQSGSFPPLPTPTVVMSDDEGDADIDEPVWKPTPEARARLMMFGIGFLILFVSFFGYVLYVYTIEEYCSLRAAENDIEEGESRGRSRIALWLDRWRRIGMTERWVVSSGLGRRTDSGTPAQQPNSRGADPARGEEEGLALLTVQEDDETSLNKDGGEEQGPHAVPSGSPPSYDEIFGERA
ncbi:uncharacterized protein VTP21DRAFT_4656 [Calcarisporiella thermophila]|uniref:uncharacterized protein n=1 Tax=Calcarisporiella thermophila TaxID=911321 RepID=UPI0037448F7F